MKLFRVTCTRVRVYSKSQEIVYVIASNETKAAESAIRVLKQNHFDADYTESIELIADEQGNKTLLIINQSDL